MLWSDFSPYVLPYVIGCPSPVMEQHTRMVSADFCRRTQCDVRDLEAFTNGIDANVDIDAPTKMGVSKVKSLRVNGVSWPLVSASHGADLVASGSTADFAYQPDDSTIVVMPIQTSVIRCVLTAAVFPAIDSTEFDSSVARQHIHDISLGVIASLMMLPGQSFTDQNTSLAFRQQYEDRVRVVSARYSVGRAASLVRSKTTYF